MGHFVRGTKRVELGVHPCGKKEYWVLKSKLSVGDRAKIVDAVLDTKMGDEGINKLAPVYGLHALMKVATVGWTLFDDDSEPIPFDPDLIDDLDPDDPIAEMVQDAIAEMNYDPFRQRASARRSDTTDESSSTDK